MSLAQHAAYLRSELGFNAVPLAYFNRDGDTKIVGGYSNTGSIMHDSPGHWAAYQSKQYNLEAWPPDAEALCILTGETSNITIIDLDSIEAFHSLQNALNLDLVEVCNYVVKTNRGYQLFFTYEPGLRPRKGVEKHIDLLGQGRLSYADGANPGYNVIKNEMPGVMPDKLKEFFLVRDTRLYKSFNAFLQEEHPLTYKKPLAKLLMEYLDTDRIGKTMQTKIEKVFATGDYAGFTYADMKDMKGGLHNFIMHMAGICAVNPTISTELYDKFLHSFYTRTMKGKLSADALNKECLDDAARLFEYNPKWSDRVEVEATVENIALEADLKVWFNPATERYYRMNISTGRTDHFSKTTFQDRFRALTNQAIDVADIDEIYHTFNPQVNAEFYRDERGAQCYNEFQRTELMDYFLTCTPRGDCPPFLNALVGNIFPDKSHRELFEHNLAYHLRYLAPCMTAIISLGKTQGTGKNTLFDGVLGLIYDTPKYHVAWKSAKFTGDFNGDLAGKLVLHGNDIKERVNPNTASTINNTLKTLVGGWPLSITGKGKETFQAPNHLFVVMSSNEAKPFTADEHDNRRLNVFPTSSTKLEVVYPALKKLSKLGIDALIKDEIRAYMEYLASIPLKEDLWNKTIKTPQSQVLEDKSTPSAHKIAQAMLDKDMEMLEEECSEDFVAFYRKEVLNKNISYIKASTLKEYLPNQRKQITDYWKTSGIDNGIHNLPREQKSALVYIVNPEGTKQETLLSGERKEVQV